MKSWQIRPRIADHIYFAVESCPARCSKWVLIGYMVSEATGGKAAPISGVSQRIETNTLLMTTLAFYRLLQSPPTVLTTWCPADLYPLMMMSFKLSVPPWRTIIVGLLRLALSRGNWSLRSQPGRRYSCRPTQPSLGPILCDSGGGLTKSDPAKPANAEVLEHFINCFRALMLGQLMPG